MTVYQLNNSKQHNPSRQASGSSASQDIYPILWKPKIYYNIIIKIQVWVFHVVSFPQFS